MRIGVLEDDTVQVELYRLWFGPAGHECVFYTAVADCLAALPHEKFDLLLLDSRLPDGSGEEVLAWAREHLGDELPIVCVTARDSEDDVVRALRMGANDYIVKPAKHLELLARVEGLVRRHGPASSTVLKFGHYEANQANREISLLGQAVDLTQKEYELALYLFQNPGKLHSRFRLLEAIWGLQNEIDTRTVDTHVSRLRRKLLVRPEHGWEIVSVYGYGYRMERHAPTGEAQAGLPSPTSKA
jgi:two-component system response regulator RegX3